MGLDRQKAVSLIASMDRFFIVDFDNRKDAVNAVVMIKSVLLHDGFCGEGVRVCLRGSSVVVHAESESMKSVFSPAFEAEHSFDGEMWGDIPNYPDYRVSSFGRVAGWASTKAFRSPVMLRCAEGEFGYTFVNLWNRNGVKTFALHRIVADVFVDGRFDDAVVDHIDGNPRNNRADNLRWVTQRDNIWDSYSRGRQMRSPKAVLQYDLTGNLVNRFDSVADVRKTFGYSHISEACRGAKRYERHYAKGYIWRYEDDALRGSSDERA